MNRSIFGSKNTEIPPLRYEAERWNSGELQTTGCGFSSVGRTRRGGEESPLNKEGGEFRALKTRYTWTFGLSVRDWRYVVRIANVPKSLVEHVTGECRTQSTENPSPSSSADHPLCALLAQALNLIPSHEGGPPRVLRQP